MNPLDIDAINTYSPYPVWNKEDEYLFKTDNGIEYSVSFDEEENFEYKSYWFNLTNISHEKSPGDVKIAKTVICIIEALLSRLEIIVVKKARILQIITIFFWDCFVKQFI